MQARIMLKHFIRLACTQLTILLLSYSSCSLAAPPACTFTEPTVQQACNNFVRTYTSAEYGAGFLDSLTSAVVARNHTELTSFLTMNVLILLDADTLSIPAEQVIRRTSLALKAVRSDTKIILDEEIISDSRQDGLFLIRRPNLFIADGITWDTRESRLTPPTTSATDTPATELPTDIPEVADLAIDVRNARGPVIIRNNTFLHTGTQIRPSGFVSVSNPTQQVEYRDNQIDSTNLYTDHGYAQTNPNQTEILTVTCGAGGCDSANITIANNTFTNLQTEQSRFRRQLPNEQHLHVAISLNNVRQFTISNNRQLHSSALGNIAIRFDSNLNASLAARISDNLGHPLSLLDTLPTITVTTNDGNPALRVDGQLAIYNNPNYSTDPLTGLPMVELSTSAPATTDITTIATTTPEPTEEATTAATTAATTVATNRTEPNSMATTANSTAELTSDSTNRATSDSAFSGSTFSDTTGTTTDIFINKTTGLPIVLFSNAAKPAGLSDGDKAGVGIGTTVGVLSILAVIGCIVVCIACNRPSSNAHTKL